LSAASVLDPRSSYAALRARDPRFDGRLFVGVTSTGIYCRPVCPARPAKFENCQFFPSAAAAQGAGFRPCLRCRPELAPQPGMHQSPRRGSSGTVTRGLALISDGALDGSDASVGALAERLGVGERQLRRLFRQHLGATPVAVAQTRRVLFAKQLIHDTRLPMSQVALAAGFGSLRRFNETFRRLYQRPPGALRRESAAAGGSPDGRSPASPEPGQSFMNGGVTIRLPYRPPYDWSALVAHLAARAIDGVERVDGETYFRTIRYDDCTGTLEVTHAPGARALHATVRFGRIGSLSRVASRIRRMFDLDADAATINSHLSMDDLLAPLVAARPGLRVPGGFDAFEDAVRAVLGQQVSLGAARTLGALLVRLCGRTLPDGTGWVFPGPKDVAATDLTRLPMPRARRDTLAALSRAAVDDPYLLEPAETLDATIAKLTAIPGVGEWTANMIALRACGEPDAFPDGDLGVKRALEQLTEGGIARSALRARAEAWRPWRGYAAQHLWAGKAAKTGRDPHDARRSIPR
jgi:AraC family transcriptional regulator of adaptative response / DNA-3-methyladenine glycosylase II